MFVGVVPLGEGADVDGAIAHINGIIGAKPFTVMLFRRFGDSIQTLIVLKSGRFSAPSESVPVGSEDPAPILEKVFGPGLPLAEIQYVETIQVTGKTYAHGCLPPHWEAWVPSLVSLPSMPKLSILITFRKAILPGGRGTGSRRRSSISNGVWVRVGRCASAHGIEIQCKSIILY